MTSFFACLVSALSLISGSTEGSTDSEMTTILGEQAVAGALAPVQEAADLPIGWFEWVLFAIRQVESA